jgi:hypothetical protein
MEKAGSRTREISCEGYHDYYQAVSNLEFFVAQGIKGVEVKDDRFVVPKHSQGKIKALFENITIFFSADKRRIKQAETDEKVKLLKQNLKTVNETHQKLYERAREECRSYDEPLTHFTKRATRLAYITEPSYQKLNRQTKSSLFFGIRWFKQRLGTDIKKPPKFKQFKLRAEFSKRVTQSDWIKVDPQILALRKKVWQNPSDKTWKAVADDCIKLASRSNNTLFLQEDIFEFEMFAQKYQNVPSDNCSPHFLEAIDQLFSKVNSLDELDGFIKNFIHFRNEDKNTKLLVGGIFLKLLAIAKTQTVNQGKFLSAINQIVENFPKGEQKEIKQKLLKEFVKQFETVGNLFGEKEMPWKGTNLKELKNTENIKAEELSERLSQAAKWLIQIYLPEKK